MTELTPQDIPALYEKHGSLKAVMRATGVSWGYLHTRYRKAVALGLMQLPPMGRKVNEHYKSVAAKQRVSPLKTLKSRHKAYILTCAQNNTNVHAPTWDSLCALAAHDGAKIMVSTFLYSKRGLGARNDKAQLKKAGTPGRDHDDIWFDPKIVPHISNDRVEIAKGLIWCGELNILPTAARPLSGLEVYTGRASMIVPHTHVAMQSIATVGGAAKLNYTTGVVTLRNYIQRKEGFKAEFHHVYGALLVEVDDDGHWWVRQLQTDNDGTLYDMDRRVKGGVVTTGHRVEAITMGDVHVANIDPDVERTTWGKDGLVDTLRPKYQFIHDVLDMYARNHHTRNDPYKGFKRFTQCKDNVELEVIGVRDFLHAIKRKECLTVVVDSNHDRHLSRWLAENDGRYDPVNAVYWSRLNGWVMNYIAANGHEPNALGLALTMPDPWFEEHNNVLLLASNASFTICDKAGGIECGLHFDRGPNGVRGSLRVFAKMGRRSNGGHSHSAGIDGGAYQAGTNSLLELEYNSGPSSWSHSDIVTYENGKRTVITFFAGKWRA